MTSKKKENAPQVEMNSRKKPPVTKSVRAGLTFPVSRVQSNLRKGNYADRIGTGGAVFLTSVLEYLTDDLLQYVGNEVLENNKHRIIPRHIMMAIKNDSELEKLLGDVQISKAGVIPFIHPVLLPKKTKANKRPPKQEETGVQR